MENSLSGEDTLATLSQQVGSSGTFFGNLNLCCVSSCTCWMFFSVIFCVGIMLFEVALVLRFVFDLSST